jgi:very-short-patch-repair endonuclease
VRANAKLAIEIDGDAHGAPDQSATDAARTAWLEDRGYRVFRFDAAEVTHNLPGLVEPVRAACEAGVSNSEK